MISLEDLYAHFLQCDGVTTDSRSRRKGAMFIALRGERFDGNRFALDALTNGCTYAIVDDPKIAAEDTRCLLVEDSFTTLCDLGRMHRRKLALPIIGITGTNGKTTTKELISAVLGSTYTIGATVGNLNNQIGVPLTLLSFSPKMQYGVVEMGASHIGDIAQLTDIAEPDFGLITNIGKAHLAGFGSYEGVIRAKSELYEWLRDHNGEAWVHAEDPLLLECAKGLTYTTYGQSQEAFFRAEIIEHPLDCFLAIAFHWQGCRYQVHTQLVGKYNFPNVAGAVAVGLRLGVAPPDIVRALEEYTPTNSRSQYVASTSRENALIVDAYNANPSSMSTAIENFLSIKSERPKYLLLGDMFELGEASLAEHKAIVQRLAALSSDVTCYLVGSEFYTLQGMFPTSHLHYFVSTEALEERLRKKPIDHALILIKASNGMHFNSLVDLC